MGSKVRGQRAEIWGSAPPTPVTQHPLPQSFHKQPSAQTTARGGAQGDAREGAPHFLVGGREGQGGSSAAWPPHILSPVDPGLRDARRPCRAPRPYTGAPILSSVALSIWGPIAGPGAHPALPLTQTPGPPTLKSRPQCSPPWQTPSASLDPMASPGRDGGCGGHPKGLLP